MSDKIPFDMNCCCSSLPELAVVPMGADGMDERVFASLEQVVERGGHQWWLYLSNCLRCSQNWMIAQDDRIYDNYYMRRLTPSVSKAIVDQGQWPDEFLTYEQVLNLGRTLSAPWTFLDRRSPALVSTAEDLIRERPDISSDEIAYLLAIPVRDAARLLQKPNLIDRFRGWIERR